MRSCTQWLIPNIGETRLTPGLGERLLEAKKLTFGVSFHGTAEAEELAEGDKVRLGDGALIEFDRSPMQNELLGLIGGRHGGLGFAL